jgi:hypothetical protein
VRLTLSPEQVKTPIRAAVRQTIDLYYPNGSAAVRRASQYWVFRKSSG